MEYFAKRLSDLIEDGEISRKVLAQKIGVSTRQLTRWTSNEANPTIENFKAICEIYHVSADDLLGLPHGAEEKGDCHDGKQ